MNENLGCNFYLATHPKLSGFTSVRHADTSQRFASLSVAAFAVCI